MNAPHWFSWRALMLATWLCGAGPAQAHLLKVFAFADGDTISGSAYFSGGARAPGAAIRIKSAAGELRARLHPDAQGRFSYRVDNRDDHVVVADTGDGHVAQWIVGAEEFTRAADVLPPADAGRVAALPETAPAGADPIAADAAQLARIERAVARQVRPLREQLIAYEDRVRLHDVLGGLGYIVGLAGLVLWWRSRAAGARR